MAGIFCSYFKEWQLFFFFFLGSPRQVQTHLPARNFPPLCNRGKQLVVDKKKKQKRFDTIVSQRPLEFPLRMLQSGPQGQVVPQSNQKSKKPHPETVPSLLLCCFWRLFFSHI